MNKKDVWIQTYTGKKFYPFNPKVEDICLEDIAWSLSNLCRFNGHCKYFYSVAEHSVYVAENVPEKYALEGLFHDAAEAYIGDIPSPIKPFFEIDLAERKLMETISLCFILDYPFSNIIKKIDMALLASEAEQTMAPYVDTWPQLQESSLDINIKGYSSIQSFRLFMNCYKNILRRRE